METNWLTWALLSALFAALSAVFAKFGLGGVNADFATLIRTVIILVVLSGFVAYAGVWTNPLRLSGTTLSCLLFSALATGASWVCYFRALKLGDASKVAPVDKLSVLIVAVLAFAFLKERPSTAEWFGIALIGAGVAIVASR